MSGVGDDQIETIARVGRLAHEITDGAGRNAGAGRERGVVSGWRRAVGFPAPPNANDADDADDADDALMTVSTSAALEEVLRCAVEVKCWPLTLKTALVHEPDFRDAQHATFYSTQFGESKFLIGKQIRRWKKALAAGRWPLHHRLKIRSQI